MEVRPREVSTPNTIFIDGWQGNTANPVEVIFPQADSLGSLPGGLYIFPGALSLNPDLMHTPGSTYRQDYPLIQFFRARDDAPLGINMIDIIIRQSGRGEVQLRLQIDVVQKLNPMGIR